MIAEGHDGYISDLSFNPDNEGQIYSASGDGLAILQDVSKGQSIRSFVGHTGDCNNVAVPYEKRGEPRPHRECRPHSRSLVWCSVPARAAPLRHSHLLFTGMRRGPT